MASLPELADLAMVVQHQLGRRPCTDHILDFPKETSGLPHMPVETKRCGLAFPSVPDYPVDGEPSQYLEQKQAVEFQQEPLLVADFPPLVEEHRDVVEVPQLRRPIHSLQPVEDERK